MAGAKKDSQSIVTAPLVIAKAADGSDRYLYRGAVFLEDGLVDGEAKRLAEFLGSQDDLVDAGSDAAENASK